MDTPLSPRDIQTRIRAGESLENLVAGSGMEAEHMEPLRRRPGAGRGATTWS